MEELMPLLTKEEVLGLEYKLKNLGVLKKKDQLRMIETLKRILQSSQEENYCDWEY